MTRLLLLSLVCGCATTPPSGGSTLYQRLGEKPGIGAAVTAIIDRVLAEPRLKGYFMFQVDPAKEPGHPTRAQVERCITEMLAAAAGGPGRYPITLSDGYRCREMKPSHQAFGIGEADFQLFVALANQTLTELNVAPADRDAVVGVLESTRTDIVLPDQPE